MIRDTCQTHRHFRTSTPMQISSNAMSQDSICPRYALNLTMMAFPASRPAGANYYRRSYNHLRIDIPPSRPFNEETRGVDHGSLLWVKMPAKANMTEGNPRKSSRPRNFHDDSASRDESKPCQPNHPRRHGCKERDGKTSSKLQPARLRRMMIGISPL
jgi:hypothetical protein